MNPADGPASTSYQDQPSGGTSDGPSIDRTSVAVRDALIGQDHPLCVIAGPCSVESREQFYETAVTVRAAGARLLRGGAFKPRTSPYNFQGLGRAGLEIMREVADEIQLGVVTEAMAPEDLSDVAAFADMIQIGARNMDNRALLAGAAETGIPILLKRGITATVREVLEAAESIERRGNDKIVICERGSRTFEPATRNSLDVAAIVQIKSSSGHPVVVDPSHGTGRRDLVAAVARAGVAAGADGVIVEVHPDPGSALSDGAQSLPTETFDAFMRSVTRVAHAVGRPSP